jgi:hypothetical protein
MDSWFEALYWLSLQQLRAGEGIRRQTAEGSFEEGLPLRC